MNKLLLNLQFFAEEVDPAPQEGEKTFTQEEVNRIVSERLSKEKGKINADREASYAKREQELNVRELKLKARESLNEKNLPSELLDVINCSNEEELERSLEILERVYRTNKKEETLPVKLSGYKPVSGQSPTGGDPIKQAMGLK